MVEKGTMCCSCGNIHNISCKLIDCIGWHLVISGQNQRHLRLCMRDPMHAVSLRCENAHVASWGETGAFDHKCSSN